MSEPRVVATAVSKSYRSGTRVLEVLRELDFTAMAGELIAVVGASGVGKSTLLHVLGGVDRVDSGEVRHHVRGGAGRDLTRLDDRELAAFRNAEIGLVFQFHYLLPEFDARENVMMPLLLRGTTFRDAAAAASARLDEVGLSERGHHRPSGLSGGEQQRVAIARALAGEPSLLLADEPTGNLDTTTGRLVFEVLAERVRARGVATIIATHNEELAARCDRCLRLVGGRLESA